jgi:hypothetical protein
MDDFAYLVRESNAAWLEGRGDGRVEAYEAYYASARKALADGFDLESANEEYPQWLTHRPARILQALSAPAVGKSLVTLALLAVASRALPHLALRLPFATCAPIVAAFVFRIYSRRRARGPA